MKYTNFNIYIFSRIKKYINTRIFNFIKLLKNLDIKKHNTSLKKKFFSKVKSFLNFRNYNLRLFYKHFNFKKKKEIFIYIILPVIFFTLVYLNIPRFHNYEKFKIEKIACKGINVNCTISGKIKYKLLPTPRIIISKLNFKDKMKKNILFGKINKIIIKLSVRNLADADSIKYKEIEIIGSEFNINVENLKNTKDLFFNNLISPPLKIKKSKINFFEGNKFLTDIKNIDFFFKTYKKKDTSALKGVFLGDNFTIKYKKSVKNKNTYKKFVTNFTNSNFFTKVELINLDSKQNATEGNILLKKDKNVLSGLINYQNNKLFLKNINLRNVFLEGKVNGYLKFDPFFDFNLDVNFNSANFNKIYNYLSALDEHSKNKLFRFNKKINGKIDLSVNKIFSKYTLVSSLESKIKLLNGNIFFDQAIFNLGKLGAADFVGNINNENKFSIFNFESNVFIDNKKKFFNKFAIYNKKKIPFNFFTSGSLDLTNLIFRINEITTSQKIPDSDVGNLQESFNAILLKNGYESLFSFMSLKDFVKSINYD